MKRGASKDLAIQKMPSEIKSYLMRKSDLLPDFFEPEIIREKCFKLTISDADSEVLFNKERKELSASEYADLKLLALKSAHDFLMWICSFGKPAGLPEKRGLSWKL